MNCHQFSFQATLAKQLINFQKMILVNKLKSNYDVPSGVFLLLGIGQGQTESCRQ